MKSKWSYLLILTASIFAIYTIWASMLHVPVFECRSRLSIKSQTNAFDKRLDFFISMNEKNKGYIFLSSSPVQENQELNYIVYFNYLKEGNYYSLHFQNRPPELGELLWVLKYDELKIKILPVSAPDYIISSPMETILMCTAAE